VLYESDPKNAQIVGEEPLILQKIIEKLYEK